MGQITTINDSSFLDLTKSLDLNLGKANFLTIPTMEVKLAMDRSGSMEDCYENGFVNKAAELFIAVAMKFDDNGVLETTFFNHEASRIHLLTAAHAGTNIIGDHRIITGGGTNFCPILDALGIRPKLRQKGFLGDLKALISKPSGEIVKTYIGILTDGRADDHDAFVRTIHYLPNVYFQIIGLGQGVEGRAWEKASEASSNLGFMAILNPYTATVDEFYRKICSTHFKDWINSNFLVDEKGVPIPVTR